MATKPAIPADSLRWYQKARNPMRRMQRRLLVNACRGPLTLDIGGGTGRTAAALSERDIEVIVVDLDVERMSYGRDRVPAVFVRGNGYRLPLRSESVDEVVMEEIIEHVNDQAAFVAEAYRVLRPGGHLVVSTPNRWPFRAYVFLLRLATLNFARLFTHVPSHVSELNGSELVCLLRQFPTIRLVGLNPFLPPPLRTMPVLGIGFLAIAVK